MDEVFGAADLWITKWMARYGVRLLRVSLGVIYLWFGFLKFFPGLSPAQGLAIKTISVMTFGLMPPHVSIILLATWECAIGLGLIFGLFMRFTLFLQLMQMIGTFTPIFFFPEACFTHFPYAWTMEGQYIFKNLVLLSAGLVIRATVRGGAFVPDPATCKLCSDEHATPSPSSSSRV
jgi:uncharacterized membrane protein YphA (DoxX/SURF4 family)